MNKSNSKQKIFTAITFQGVTVKVVQIIAESKEKAEGKLINVIGSRKSDKALMIDDIMKHRGDWSYAVFDANKIESI